MPITKFLSCTDPLDQFESLSYHQTQHAKTYVTGLVAGRNKTVTGIAREVLPANSERALNKFLAEYDWDEDQLNTNGSKNCKNTVRRGGHKTATSLSTTRLPRKPGTNSPASASSTITLKATLSEVRTSSTPSTPTRKQRIRSRSASTRTRIRSSTSPERSSPNSKKR